MNHAREEILRRVRRALKRDADSVVDPDTARDTAYASERAPRPTWDEKRLQRFTERFEAAAGTWCRVSGPGDISGAAVDFLHGAGLGQKLQLAAHPMLDTLRWPDQFKVACVQRADPGLSVGLSIAEAAIAETGTLVFWSGPRAPATLAFLSEVHIAVLPLEWLVDHMEDVWTLLRKRDGFPPRALNLVTGPSRTADVEQTMQLGAHGPRRLHLILVG